MAAIVPAKNTLVLARPRPSGRSFAANGSCDKIRRMHRGKFPPSPRDMIAILRSAFGFRCACRVGLRRGVTRRSDRGSGSRRCDHRAAPRAPVGIDRAERQKIIPANEDPGGLASLQGSRINDLGAMIFRILRGNTVRRFNVFPAVALRRMSRAGKRAAVEMRLYEGDHTNPGPVASARRRSSTGPRLLRCRDERR